MIKNIDNKTVKGFGEEWLKFDQSKLSNAESLRLFNLYFDIFPWDKISSKSIGFDLGCGTGRWAKIMAAHVKELHCIDPSEAIKIAEKNLTNAGIDNCKFYKSDSDDMPISDSSMDFGYSIGVLHHVPDTSLALKNCVKKLKKNSPFLVYIYYDFDGRPYWYKKIWISTELIRKVVSKMPFRLRYIMSQIFAFTLYFPLARLSLILDKFNINTDSIPLSAYKYLSFYTMRTDALDRFGTILEKRFSREGIEHMMTDAGLVDITFSKDMPYWCAVGLRK